MVAFSKFLDAAAHLVNNTYSFMTAYVSRFHIDLRVSAIAMQLAVKHQIIHLDKGACRSLYLPHNAAKVVFTITSESSMMVGTVSD